RAGDVVVGDVLLGDDNHPRTVVARQDGISRMYEIVPVKGMPWVCNENHILSLVCNAHNAFGKSGDKVDIGLQEYLRASKSSKHTLKQYSVGFDGWGSCGLFDFDPYLVGVWLGDGDSNG